ncbi:MAG: GNAT family N-acetyltransferase [Phycisphaera sp.]|nr:GNAT family N-acetyltransferase [Phycisphaera sp.]
MTEVRRADLFDETDCAAVVALVNTYSLDPLGAGQPLSEEARGRLIPALREAPSCVCFIARRQGADIGLVVCFRFATTFNARPALNIHDVIVHPDHRGVGVGRAMLDTVERYAREELGCAKLSLEVRTDNAVARGLYASLGFSAGEHVYEYWTKPL